jgi:hypothetical protein
MYGAELSPRLISSVTDAVMDDAAEGLESGIVPVYH